MTCRNPVTGKPYAPLNLDPEYWASRNKSVARNFVQGAHDYGAVIALLQDANPDLDIRLSYK